MTNDFDVIDNDYVQVPKIIISILQDQVAVINNLSKHHTNSKDIIYTAKGVALSNINNNWIAPFGIYKEACYVPALNVGALAMLRKIVETVFVNPPFKQGYVTPEQLLKLFGRFED